MSKPKYNCEFSVEGMHCAACELLIEKNLSKFKGVKSVDVVLNQNKVYLELEEGIDSERIRQDLSSLIEPDGYRLIAGNELIKEKINYKDLIIGALIAVLFLVGFLLLQTTGLFSLQSSQEITLPFVFFVGVLASISTCMAVVGGLCISISSNYAKENKFKPLAMFHISRIIGFFVLAGIIGLLGSAFVLTQLSSLVLSLILFVVMVIMGISLLDIFPWSKRLQISMPKFLSQKALNVQDRQGFLTPVLLGLVTFFLPCGFTQSMQIYSLGTGSFLNGALTMLFFALGTFPVLGLISFASVKLSKTFQSGIFFKTAGFLVLLFGAYNLFNALVAFGVIVPTF